MSSMLPSKIEKPQTWIVSPSGEVSAWKPTDTTRRKPLTSGQKHAALRLAVAHALRLLKGHGFKDDISEQSDCAINVSYAGFHFDISVRESCRIAYVTSVLGDKRDRKKVGEDMHGNSVFDTGPGVSLASESMNNRHVVQVVVSKISSESPVYIDFPENEPNPVAYVLKNILLLVVNHVREEKIADCLKESNLAFPEENL